MIQHTWPTVTAGAAAGGPADGGQSTVTVTLAVQQSGCAGEGPGLGDPHCRV
jgi:hypothetical protein